ncbi:hydroxyethylthiazole kinase [Natribacillus halophilus]|uniref:Hydroxyethylthiazole kinase n=1 Tax=Natribacillus halophilus TaxID=549003 RepID=A0A1G8R439_9BACI|nr:hydroxyethylthiazole kinase [Natribacillus halophilus]SDJ11170.1 hydroxyethylthiazole kinase [Natribacillus halophilus]
MIDDVRKKNPLIHCITNEVVTNFTANGLLAVGAAPVMTGNHEEVEEMAQIADGLLLNTGTLTPYQYEAMRLAGRAANESGTPVVLDPVAVGATSYRTRVVKDLLQEVTPDVIRGNGGEIAALIGMHSQMHGVEGQSDQAAETLAKEAAKVLGTTVCVTGEVDAISDGTRTYQIKNGHEWLARVVGTGCLLGAVILAYIASGQEKGIVQASAAGLAQYGVASEEAFARAKEDGVGTFQQRFLDALSFMNSTDGERKSHIVEP